MTTVTPPKPSILDKLLAPLPGERDRQAFPVPRMERFGERELRATIQRDLAWLLNDIQFAAAVPLDEHEEVRTAVLNHGLPEIVGRALDVGTMRARADEIVGAIRAFEQRLRPETVRVTFDMRLVEAQNKLHFSIEGEIRNAVEESWIELATTIDLDDGRVEVGA